MAKKSIILIEIVLSLLLIASFISADTDLGPSAPCFTDDECQMFVPMFQLPSYCNLVTSTCFTVSPITATPPLTFDQTSTNLTNVTVPVAPVVEDSAFTSLGDRVNVIETSVSSIQQQVNELQGKTDELNTKVTSIESTTNNLNTNLQSFNSQQEQNKEELKKDVTSISTGLAVLQSDINATQGQIDQVKTELEQKSSTLWIITTVLIILILSLAGAGVYYYFDLQKKREEKFEAELTPAIHAYLTQQIKIGKKFIQIKDNLMETGWSEEEARWAYKETMRHNYHRFLGKTAPKEAPSAPTINLPTFDFKTLFQHDATKVLSILIVSVLIILGGLLLLRGVTTGKAIQMGTVDLYSQVGPLLEQNLANNIFYTKLKFADICVQVEDQGQSISYRVLKTSLGHALTEALQPCDYNSEAYDFSVKFLNFQSFDLVINDLSCSNLQRVNNLQQNLVILPSKYILPGFGLNSEKDVSKYCEVLQECLSSAELAVAGINC
ncbi:MAG: hypothetical protein WCV90_08135 [Candidatus Woesearchaeota archaeon]